MSNNVHVYMLFLTVVCNETYKFQQTAVDQRVVEDVA
ncbi:hypothetical protein T09_9921 [Trichinella sp. T9]|nr:hypothetical protein T09_9921 [Trichinella sp. T9]